MERLRHEVLEDFFFPAPVFDEEGNIIPAPKEAVDKYEELRANWLLCAPTSDSEKLCVALYPVITEEKQGYVVAKQIIYKPS